MKTRRFCSWVCLAAGLAVSSWSSALEAAEARLFPDLVLRYPVGDTNALNPLRFTEGPKCITTGDLNGDGLADIITGNLDGSVSVLLAKAQGGMQDQILTPATGLLESNSFRAIVTADFNGDGKLDVAAADIARGGVVILLGHGDGTLTPFGRMDLGPARALATGDFDRDGKPDLLLACSPADCDTCQLYYTNTTVSRFLGVLRGNGDGTFQPPQYVLSPGVKACFYDVKAADINQDGQMDILALDFSVWHLTTNQYTWHKHILIFTNLGDGTFTTDQPQEVLQTAGEGPRAFALGYIDEVLPGGTNVPAGATLDIVVANRDSASLDVFLNHGDLSFGEFGAPLTIAVGDSPRDVALADLDGDGYSDLVVVDRDEDNLSVLPGRGDGMFDAASFILPTGVSPRQVVLADLNGDGVLDAAVNNRVSEDISIFIGAEGVAGFLLPAGLYPAGYTPVSVVAVDFNGDGLPDLATANMRSHDVRVRLNLGDGTFGPEAIYPVNYGPAVLAAGDLDGDGRSDLLVSCLGSGNRGSLVALLSRGDGTFRDPISSFPATNITYFRPYWLRLGDLAGGGRLDAAVGGVDGKLVLFKGRGDGSFEPGVISCLGGDGRPLGLALGDFDRDGRLDIATSRGKVFMNDGQLFPTNGSTVWTGRTKLFNAGAQAWAVEAEDLDNDGNLDLMVALTFQRPDPIGVLFGRGDGTFSEPDVYEGPDVGAVAIVGRDMDGDGVKDIVIGNRCAATVIIMKGVANRRFELREVIRAYSVEGLAVADLDQDGKPDIVGVGMGLWPLFNGRPASFGLPKASQMGSLPEREGLYINELMALNQTFFITNGSTPDWLEIYNYGRTTQSLAGWSLTQYTRDGDTNRWEFPVSSLIPPWGHLVVFCKKNAPSNSTEIVTAFELSSDGETVVLSGPGGVEVDRVRYPAMPADVSYARFTDGARFFSLNPAATMGAANARPANVQPIAERKDPYVGPGGSSLGLTGRFYDDIAVAYAAVCFRLAGTTNFTEVPFSDDGAHGDKEPGDGYYGAMLPTLPAGATVEYYLRVVDLEGQVDTDPGNIEDPANLHHVNVPQPSQNIRLSELLADNKTGLRDERGQYEDWIELFNAGTNRVSLDGLVLTRDYFDRSNAWHFPANYWVNPGERLLVICDEDRKQGPLHANFKLLRDGDRVYLLQAANWTVIDSLSFGALPSDTSFGVLGRGLEAQMLAWPTPGAANLAIPPRRSPSGPAVEMFYRLQPLPGIAPATVALRWQGTSSGTYLVQYSEDLHNWTNSLSPVADLGQGLLQWIEPQGLLGKRFYRVVFSPTP